VKQSASLRVSLTEDPVVEDADAFDGEDCSIYAEPPRDVGDLIEEELCFVHPSGTHTYFRDRKRCDGCGAAHPSIRANACGQL
jgi:hypothetical protein